MGIVLVGLSIWRGSRLHSIFAPMLVTPLVHFPSSLDEQLCADMEKPSQLFCLRFADGALPVKYLGSNSFRAEYFPEVFLSQAARLHQMLECPLRTCLPN